MTPDIETSRLILRPLSLEDAPRTQVLIDAWEVVRYLASSVPWPYPPDGALAYYRDVVLPNIARGDEWAWTIRLKAPPAEHIGAISLYRSETENRGFWLGTQWHRQGFMTEAVHAVNDFWFNTLGFDLLRTPKAALNLGSSRISASTGMRLVKTFEKPFVSGTLPAELWELTREEWNARTIR